MQLTYFIFIYRKVHQSSKDISSLVYKFLKSFRVTKFQILNMKPTFAINCFKLTNNIEAKSIEKLNLYFISHIDRRGKEKTLQKINNMTQLHCSTVEKLSHFLLLLFHFFLFL